MLRRWAASLPAAALGGALFGFSPALRIAAIGHYHLQFAILLPLIVDALLCILTGRGRPVRTGAWLGLLLAAQLFIAEEALALLGVTAAVIAVVLALSRPRAVASRIRGAAAGLATAAGVMLVLSGYGLWRQFHGPLAEHGSPWSLGHFHNRPGQLRQRAHRVPVSLARRRQLPGQPPGQDGRGLRLSGLADAGRAADRGGGCSGATCGCARWP